ncbi:hypothetical protein DBV15_06442 [Temnothorax longispinosus]|uniref:Uncharacterized protein n=1 Tax=Temnothorax longispinosus TaxID=300112 RepID=A0A4S2KNH6_9HYME|nr:hypothetical protein DBV15_06442 [Temnothorax longispinosus]
MIPRRADPARRSAAEIERTRAASVASGNGGVGRDDNKTQKVASTDLKFSFPGADDWQRDGEQQPSGALTTVTTALRPRVTARVSRSGDGRRCDAKGILKMAT